MTHAVMAGQVKHTKLFSDIVPDMMALGLLMRLKAKNTDAIIAGVADVLRDHGIELIDSTAFLEPLLAKPGVLTQRAPNDDEQRRLGVRLRDGRRDCRSRHRPDDRRQGGRGRRRGSDGRHRRGDRRAGQLAGPGVCVVKVAKPKQDMRFDVPVVGVRDHRGHAGGWRHGPVGGCRQDADDRR